MGDEKTRADFVAADNDEGMPGLTTPKYHGWAPGDFKAELARLKEKKMEAARREVEAAKERMAVKVEIEEVAAALRSRLAERGPDLPRHVGAERPLGVPRPAAGIRTCYLCHRFRNTIFVKLGPHGEGRNVCGPCYASGVQEMPPRGGAGRCDGLGCGERMQEYLDQHNTIGNFCSVDCLRSWWRGRVRCQVYPDQDCAWCGQAPNDKPNNDRPVNQGVPALEPMGTETRAELFQYAAVDDTGYHDGEDGG